MVSAPVPAALLFDVFGTLVDWRSGIIAALRAFGERTGATVDWAEFADDWRAAYAPSMDRVRRGEIPWQPLDALHRESLSMLFERYDVTGISALETDRVTHAWHTLPAWSDTVAGLRRLRERFIIGSLSNGNVALQVDLRRSADLPFDMLFSAELFEHYKPDPQPYEGACAMLALAPERVMLVAAHPSDLRAAAACGLQTAFIARPFEYGTGVLHEAPAPNEFGYAADSIEVLADRLGA